MKNSESNDSKMHFTSRATSKSVENSEALSPAASPAQLYLSSHAPAFFPLRTHFHPDFLVRPTNIYNVPTVLHSTFTAYHRHFNTDTPFKTVSSPTLPTFDQKPTILEAWDFAMASLFQLLLVFLSLFLVSRLSTPVTSILSFTAVIKMDYHMSI